MIPQQNICDSYTTACTGRAGFYAVLVGVLTLAPAALALVAQIAG